MLKSWTLHHRAQQETQNVPDLLLKAQEIAASVQHGTHARRKSGAGENFWQYREYREGDRPQDIDWRRSARGDEVFIKQREMQSIQRAGLWCASYAGMDFHSGKNPSKKIQAQIITLALAILLRDAGEQVGLIEDSSYGTSAPHLHDIAEHMVRKVNAYPLPHIHRAPLKRNMHVILVGDFLEELSEIEAALKPIAGLTQNVTLIQTLDPAEIALPYSGRGLFVSPQNQDKIEIPNIDDIRSAYQEKVTAHRAALHALVHSYGWHFFDYQTDQELPPLITQTWLSMTGGA